jgi:hypothetical protein
LLLGLENAPANTAALLECSSSHSSLALPPTLPVTQSQIWPLLCILRLLGCLSRVEHGASPSPSLGNHRAALWRSGARAAVAVEQRA